MSELVEAQARRLMGMALGCSAKEVADLTEDEKCALAWCAGVEMVCGDWERTETSMTVRLVTKNPIGIVKIDGKFRVYERVQSEGERLRKLGLLHFED